MSVTTGRRLHMDTSRLAVFSPVHSTARVDAVVRRLTDAIGLGLLADGEQLPSETELAGRFGVSIVTLREALVDLRRQGLVETRRGRGGGSFVRTPAFDLGVRLRSFAADELRDLGDHYAAIGGAAARLAAERSLPGDVTPLFRSLEEMSRVRSAAQLRGLDGRFHIEVAAASQSARLTQEEIRLQADLGPLVWQCHEHPAGRRLAQAEHRAIAEAVRRGDGGDARNLAERHVLDAIGQLIDLRLSL
jgi:DNA-binding FadR family transcriptional regulator